MASLRNDHPDDPPSTLHAAMPNGGRLNLLLSYGGWREESWADRLPRLLEPMGVRAWRAKSASEATRLIADKPVHIAVVDLSLPMEEAASGGECGERVLELLRRQEAPPPTIVVKKPAPARDATRQLSTALREGAFAVVDRPVQLEMMLELLRRALTRVYQGRWPGTT